MLQGSHYPHYDGESKRRPAYHQLVLQGNIQAGYAADDGAALHFMDGRLHKVVSSTRNAQAYHVELEGNSVRETKLTPDFLG